MEYPPDPQSIHATGPETKGFPESELRTMSEAFPQLDVLLGTIPPTMQPSPVVLFTGAGASKPLGMPTMLEFRKQFSDTLPQNDEAVLWQHVVAQSAEFYGTSPESIDIEQVLTCIEGCELSPKKSAALWESIYGMQHGVPTIEQIHEFRQGLWSIRNDVLDKICATYTDPEPKDVMRCYVPLFKMLEDTTGQTTTNVFTTNYDLTFEVLGDTKPDIFEFEVVDGFRSQSPGVEVFARNFVPKYNARHAIVLRKLHGSTSWKGQLPNPNFLKASPGKYVHDDGKRTIIIYPTRKKAASQNLHTSPFNQAYGGLESLFSQMDILKVLLVIGYGFGDTEVREAIEHGLTLEDRAEVVVVDPSATHEHVAGLFPNIDKSRFRVIQCRFGEDTTLKRIEEELRSALGNS